MGNFEKPYESVPADQTDTTGASEELEISKSEGNTVEELLPDNDGYRRVEIDGQPYKIIARDETGEIIEMIPYSKDASGNIEYGTPVKSEHLFAKVDPEVAKKYEKKLHDFTAENYESLDTEDRDRLIANFFSGTDQEINDRIEREYTKNRDSLFHARVFSKVGYKKGMFQVGHGWNERDY
jgi:hypothetical protein